jgi:polyisoprenoid-binding protein YceI
MKGTAVRRTRPARALRVVRTQMTALRFSFDPVRSCVWVDARSSLLPIKTQTRGLQGWVDVALHPDGTVDLDVPVQGRLEISVDRLSSGNQLYDRELRRRIDARRHPLIIGQITGVRATEVEGRYLVAGDLLFHGKTRVFEHEMTIAVDGESTIELRGDRVFDIREFGMKPPSMLMLKVYPEVAVRVELYGGRER